MLDVAIGNTAATDLDTLTYTIGLIFKTTDGLWRARRPSSRDALGAGSLRLTARPVSPDDLAWTMKSLQMFINNVDDTD
ncbi:hypothetical protein EVAR_89213_1 [Eumeta japonica]|uniref:Uncharacterized protein n=1 Tax=Eumeta variegata TaxID=151549 RepID=A0A4C2A9W9_EUMVA|nr:hypothetical protein EVAR_89213_1 [Eumeta japonica]